MAATTTTFIRIINDTEINQVGVVTSTFNIGQPGLSAYNQAVSGGYTGTFEEFTADLNSIHNKVDKIENYSLVPDLEIEKLSEYPELPEVPEGYYLADDGTFKALPDFVTEQEMEEYVDTILGDINTALETILAIEV